MRIPLADASKQLVSTYMEHEVYLANNGQFCTQFEEGWVGRASLTALKALIEQREQAQANPVRCMRIHGYSTYPTIHELTGIVRKRDGTIYSMIDKEGKELYGDLAYVVDEGAMEKLTALADEHNDARAIYDAAMVRIRKEAEALRASLERVDITKLPVMRRSR